jgi:hypothetical protein
MKGYTVANVDLEKVIKHQVDDAISKYRMGEETDYAVALAWTPNSSGSLTLAWNIVLVQKSPLIGQRLAHVIIEPEPAPSPEKIDAIVMAGCSTLREMRAQALSVTNGSGQ